MTDESLHQKIAKLGRIVLPHDLTLTSAESCTGGMLASSLVGDIDVSAAFERGFVVYSVDAKCELLGLERRRVEECGGVAEDIARAMARAALAFSKADLAAATTGFAGPQETDEEVGLVYVATASRAGEKCRTLRLGDIGRNAVCQRAVETAVELLIESARDLVSLSADDPSMKREGVS